MIRDRIVYTCLDKRTKEALIRADKLDLDSAIRICRAAESARDSMRELGASSTLSVASVAAASSSSASSSHNSRRRDRRDHSSQRVGCRNCGTSHVSVRWTEKNAAAATRKVTTHDVVVVVIVVATMAIVSRAVSQTPPFTALKTATALMTFYTSTTW